MAIFNLTIYFSPKDIFISINDKVYHVIFSSIRNKQLKFLWKMKVKKTEIGNN